jgi:hypothetical protein
MTVILQPVRHYRPKWAPWLAVSHIALFKLARSGRIPSFRIATCVRFDPRAVANWLR